MDETMFWTLVENVHQTARGDMDAKCTNITKELSKRSCSEVQAFAALFDEMMDEAYSWKLWGAAYVIGGGCSDDAFMDFRSSLISRGRKAFESALADPESLATENLEKEDWFYEGYQYAVTDSVRAVCGEVAPRTKPHPKEPSGTDWSEDKVHELFPKLSAKYA